MPAGEILQRSSRKITMQELTTRHGYHARPTNEGVGAGLPSSTTRGAHISPKQPRGSRRTLEAGFLPANRCPTSVRLRTVYHMLPAACFRSRCPGHALSLVAIPVSARRILLSDWRSGVTAFTCTRLTYSKPPEYSHAELVWYCARQVCHCHRGLCCRFRWTSICYHCCSSWHYCCSCGWQVQI